MSAKTNYLEDKIIDHVLNNTAYTSPTTVYVSLHTADPGEAGSLAAEVAGGSYARQAAAFSASAGGSTANPGAITFPTATVGWGTITHFGICDAVSAGNMLYYGPLTAARTVLLGDVFEFATGGITISEL